MSMSVGHFGDGELVLVIHRSSKGEHLLLRDFSGLDSLPATQSLYCMIV